MATPATQDSTKLTYCRTIMSFLALDLKALFIIFIHAQSLQGHFFSSTEEHVVSYKNFSQTSGVVVSFQQRILSGDFFLGFHSWDKINSKYGATNITYIVRIEFDRWTYKHLRLNKTYHRFWLPGVLWLEKTDIGKEFYNRKFNLTRSRYSSVVDLWVEPECFLRNHGISRIYRITRSLRMHVYNLRWLAKITFPVDLYDFRELRQFGKFLTQISGVDCAWIHPRMDEGTSLLIRFDPDRVTGKKFFSPEGFHDWDELNDQYQVVNIGYLRGWNRAVLDFTSGMHCKETTSEVALKYKHTTGISSVYRNEYSNCRLTYRILVKFNHRHMTPASIHYYNDWSSLNYMYGVVNISYHEDARLIAHLEFEPGLYTNHQMKAIRSEYLKLHGILFAWVEGVPPEVNTRMVLRMWKEVNLAEYTEWNTLNSKYFTQVIYIDHNAKEATLELPQGRYSADKVLDIYEEYRRLPKVSSVKTRPFYHDGRKVASERGGVAKLRRTIWEEVKEKDNKAKEEESELPNDTRVRYTPLYVKYRNKTDNSMWEDHCDFH